MRDRQAVQHAERRRRAPSRSSARAASAIARSATSVTMALTRGLTRSIRARCAAITSRAETSLRRMRAASSIGAEIAQLVASRAGLPGVRGAHPGQPQPEGLAEDTTADGAVGGVRFVPTGFVAHFPSYCATQV